MSDVKPVPDGCSTVSVYLVVPNSVEAMKFYQREFFEQMAAESQASA